VFILEKIGLDYEKMLAEALKELRLSVGEVDVVTEPAGEMGQGLIRLQIKPKADRSAEAMALLEEILDHMGIYADIRQEEDEREIRLFVSGPNIGLIIGRKGATLTAIQTLVNLIHNKHHSVRKNVVINGEGYRERRLDELEKQVRTILDKVQRDGQPRRIELTQPEERKFVHNLVSQRKGLTSRSVGGKFKHSVVIEPRTRGERRGGDGASAD